MSRFGTTQGRQRQECAECGQGYAAHGPNLECPRTYLNTPHTEHFAPGYRGDVGDCRNCHKGRREHAGGLCP